MTIGKLGHEADIYFEVSACCSHCVVVYSTANQRQCYPIANASQRLVEARTQICEALAIDESDCELSMGMSNDFERAVCRSCSRCVCECLTAVRCFVIRAQIELGSTNVRVGSSIFGTRAYKSSAAAEATADATA